MAKALTPDMVDVTEEAMIGLLVYVVERF